MNISELCSFLFQRLHHLNLVLTSLGVVLRHLVNMEPVVPSLPVIAAHWLVGLSLVFFLNQGPNALNADVSLVEILCHLHFSNYLII